MWTQSVYSSNVTEIGYEAETQELFVTWTRGKRSIYAGVPEDTAIQCANAASVGSFLNAEIKPFFRHRYG